MSGHILVVDDDDTVREALCDALELEGYRAVGMPHGAAAMQHLRTGARPCLILLDLMMPVMDGRTFRQTMLADESLTDIPIIIITAAGGQAAADLPASRILPKPLHMDSVIDVVQEHCRPNPPP
jgi:CheY-like chemotaxis protein